MLHSINAVDLHRRKFCDGHNMPVFIMICFILLERFPSQISRDLRHHTFFIFLSGCARLKSSSLTNMHKQNLKESEDSKKG